MEDYRSKRTGDQIEDLLDIVSQGGTGDNRFFSPISVEEFYDGVCSENEVIVDATEFINAAREGKIICVPYAEGGFVITTYKFIDGQGEDLSFILLIANDAYVMRVSSYYTGTGYELRIDNSAYYEPVGHLIIPQPNGFLVLMMEASSTTIYEPVSYLNVAILTPLQVGATVRFTTEENCTFEFISDTAEEICWANGVLPILEPNTTYELSVTTTLDVTKILVAVTPFKPAA